MDALVERAATRMEKGMQDRGALAVGMPADVLVYDLKALRVLDEEIAYDFPGGEWRRIKRAEGYRYTIVTGVVTFEGMRCTGATPGKLLRFGRGWGAAAARREVQPPLWWERAAVRRRAS